MQYVSQLPDDEGALTISQDIFGKAKEVTGVKANGEPFSAMISVSHFVIEEKICYSMIIHDMSELKRQCQSDQKNEC